MMFTEAKIEFLNEVVKVQYDLNETHRIVIKSVDFRGFNIVSKLTDTEEKVIRSQIVHLVNSANQ